MFVKVKNWFREFRLSLRMKIALSFSAIAVVLLMSSIISVLEYRHMSNYVSSLIASNVNNIHRTQELLNAVDGYNLKMLAVIGDEVLTEVPSFDYDAFLERSEDLKETLGDNSKAVAWADSVVYAYSAYMLAATELEEVFESSFINTRDWYFTRLQPLFGRLRVYLDRLSSALYEELEVNSKNFDSGFFRSIIPSSVAVSVGIILVFLLMFYIQSYYVKPIYRMLRNLRDYLGYRRRYTYTFDGNDQLNDLNTSITELTEENRSQRRRIADLKDKQ
jgi:predicted PurR-regulated permease PerM